MKSRKKRLREVYVWELPVRIYHWVNALCIVILCVTGFIIADPPAIMSASEAYFSYWFGVVRFIHFVTATMATTPKASVTILPLLQFRIPALLGIRRESLCQME